MDRLTVQEAAARLGVKEDAVRKRMQRGSLAHEKEDGRVYVYLDVTQDTTQDASYPQVQVEGNGELVEELRDRVGYLERQLDQEREARTEERRRHDTLLAQLMQRIPELEAPREQRDGRETASEHANGAAAALADVGGDQAASEPRSSWWRRMFGS